jgi:OOP family OmpA-OmpF porin
MKDSRIAGSLALAIAVALGAAPAVHADDAEWYAGVGAGRSVSKLDYGRIAAELDAPGFTTTSIDTNTHRNTYKLFGGYQFGSNFALEGSYFDLGKSAFYAPTAPNGGVNGTLDVRGFALDAVAILPFTDRFGAFAKIGVTEAQTRDSFDGTGGDVIVDSSPSHWHVNGKVGAGLQYLVTPHFGVRAEWERYRINDAVRDHGNIDAVTVSLVFPFGATPAPAPMPVAYVQPPAPVVAPPPPPVVVAPPPAPVVPRHVTFDADALFAFNSSTIRPEGSVALDSFAGELHRTHYDQVHVTGYTDRIGSRAYNLRLSQQRADAVRDYLVNHGGIDAGKIDAEGKGMSDPVTAPGQCGKGRSAAVIACLQPDRRVDFEVAGTEK